MVVCATDGFGIRNQGASVADQMAALAAIVARRKAEGGPPISVTISVAFGCPFDGEVSEDQVAALARDAGALGVGEIALADTIGVADPWTVRRRIEAVRKAAPNARLRMHFHDTRGTGLANAFASGRGGRHGARRQLRRPRRLPVRAGRHRQHRHRGPGLHAGRAPASRPATTSAALIEAGRWIGEKIGKPPVSALSRAGGFPGVGSRAERGGRATMKRRRGLVFRSGWPG